MNKRVLLLIGLAFFLLSLFFSVYTHARYYTRVNVESTTMYTASWNFEVNNSPTSFTTDLGDLYPGVNRSFNLNLSSLGSDVPIDYTITFSNPRNIPGKLVFYEDSEKQHVIDLDGGTITGGMGANTNKLVTIYYDWAYEGAEEPKTGSTTFNMTVVGIQRDPNS